MGDHGNDQARVLLTLLRGQYQVFYGVEATLILEHEPLLPHFRSINSLCIQLPKMAVPDQTIIYKRLGSLEIPMDLYLPKNAHKAPILLWFHGGGLLLGRRDLLAPHMRNGVHTHGYACVSADYRLCPQVSVEEVFKDVQDCIKFIRTELPSHVPEGALDVSRLAVSGSPVQDLAQHPEAPFTAGLRDTRRHGYRGRC